ncbi:MAG: hypothetical protein WAL40_13915 [Rhodoplanes sp.]
MRDAWPWLTLAGLGAYHGLNPAMGWLFAVALGMHRQSRAVVYTSLLPIAAGHAASIAAAAVLMVVVGALMPSGWVRVGCGLLLLGWAAYLWRFGHRHRVRFGMQTGLLGLLIWSFLMATAHGAGLMLWPALMPLCFPETPSAQWSGPAASALMSVGVHTATMLAVTAAIAGLVYEWVGLEQLRRRWLNVDLVWLIALVATGVLLLVT